MRHPMRSLSTCSLNFNSQSTMRDVSFLPLIESILPSAAWEIQTGDLYTFVRPKAYRIPEQGGWKVFCACHYFNAEGVIRRASSVCIELCVPFKFVNSQFLLSTEILGKQVPPAESGKAFVVYPGDEKTCHRTLNALSKALEGFDASPVLSARNYASDAPVYYRYASFVGGRLWNPETEEYIPDFIRPWYSAPSFIRRDPFRPDLDEDDADTTEKEMTLKDGRYEIREALVFCNSGGRYLANDAETGGPCFVKEARPHIAPHPETGDDAVDRLKREVVTLKQAQNCTVAPKYIDDFSEETHLFLVRDYIEGETLADTQRPFPPDALARLAEALEDILALRKTGVAGLDLAPQNIIFDGTRVKLLDYETSTDSTYPFGTKGFIAPPGVCPWEWAIGKILDYCR